MNNHGLGDYHQDYAGLNRGNFEANVAFCERTRLLNSDKKILEVGSGNGIMVNYLQRQGYNVVGIDINTDYIETCKNMFGITLLEMSGDDLEFDSESFDLVLSFDVIEHIPDINAHFSEVKRVLKRGGSYLFQTPNKLTNIPFEIAKSRSLTKYKTYHCSLQTVYSLKSLLKMHDFAHEIIDIPVMNDFVISKVKNTFGPLGVSFLKLINIDNLPLFLRTNFYVCASINEV